MQQKLKWGLTIALVKCITTGLLADQEKTGADPIPVAVAKALPLLQKGAAGHAAQRTCFSCHHQALPVLAMKIARERGFDVDEGGFRKQLEFTHNVLAGWAKRTTDRKNFLGGQADTAGHALLTLELGGWKADGVTTAVVEYLLQRNQEIDHWRNVSNRPPTEASVFTTTALAIRGLMSYGVPEQRQRIVERVVAAHDWLVRTPPRDTEDRVYRLWGLKFAQATPEHLQAAKQDLLLTQGVDGGWSQTEKMTSDPYATGSALVALHLAGNLPITDKSYQRGVAFLLRQQQPDGSWYVKSRSKPFQTYFETGFPHGKDQWISSSASSWATAALALAYSARP